jgi:O-acetylhomoserine (thiol)-lyase
VLFGESIPNPTNDLFDIAAVAELAHAHGIPLVIDSTLASPYLLRPIEHGADIVVHSASKFLAGQGAVLGGVVVDNGRFDAERSGALFPHLLEADRLGGPSLWERAGGRARIAYLRDSVALRFGPTASPLNSFLIHQGIETLSLRVERQSANALAIATWLEQRPEVETVQYAGLPSHASHALAQRYLPNGFGSVFSFTLRGGLDAARAFVNALVLFTHMTHLGDVRSLVLHPASTSHNLRSPEEQAAAGILPGTLRVSIGIEDLPDLLADLERGLDAARVAPTSTRAAQGVAA